VIADWSALIVALAGLRLAQLELILVSGLRSTLPGHLELLLRLADRVVGRRTLCPG
jgi:hypothetical protein